LGIQTTILFPGFWPISIHFTPELHLGLSPEIRVQSKNCVQCLLWKALDWLLGNPSLPHWNEMDGLMMHMISSSQAKG
jgi:hypothetical protein